MRDLNLRGHVDSYDEHWQKAVRALGDPEMAQTVNGWVRRLKDFAEAAYKDCILIQDNGGHVTSRNDSTDIWTRDRVEEWFSKKMSDVIRLKEQNDEIARKHGIPLAHPW